MMARRKKSCDFCEGEILIQENIGITGEFGIEFYPDNNLFSVNATITDDDFHEVQQNFTFNYCPKCGRKLGA